MVAQRYSAELYGGVGHAAEFDEVEMDGLEHAANLAVLAFADADDEPGVVAGVAVADDVCGEGDVAVIEHDALAEPLDAGVHVIDDAAQLGLINLCDFVARVGEQLGQFTIVGEDDGALGVPVEAADGVDAAILWRDERGDDRASLGVGGGRDVADGLVNHQVDLEALGLDAATVEVDHIFARFHRGAERLDDDAVDLDSAGFDEGLTGPSAGDTCGREIFLESFSHGVPRQGGRRPRWGYRQ